MLSATFIGCFNSFMLGIGKDKKINPPIQKSNSS
jgi:hypothetical protein